MPIPEAIATMAPVLLVAAPGVPLLIAALWLVPHARRALSALAPWGAVPALLLAWLYLSASGRPLSDTVGFLDAAGEAGSAGGGQALYVPSLFTGLSFAVDPLGGAFLLLTALLWFAGGVFARSYHATDDRRDAFFAFFSLTMAGNVGLVLAGDLLTFYLCFAVMTFAAYGLVVHRRDAEALRAGRVYVVLALVGELAILAGLLALGFAAGGMPAFGPELEAAWSRLAEGTGIANPTIDALSGGVTGAPDPVAGGFLASATTIAMLLVAGFGIKAGLVPLHVWLPLAHPVAPTAASALLSGAMIKAGLLGWMRALPTDLALTGVGVVLLVLGVFTAFYGVFAGLPQRDAKTILAYSSVSQMGYMSAGMGIVLMQPSLAPWAIPAVVFYALHHGLAKGALFLSVGLADRAGGASSGPSRWRRAILLGALFPALALGGAPFTSGARAKELLKSALEELGGGWQTVIEPLLIPAAAGTTLLLLRFLVVLAGRPSRGERAVGVRGLALPWAMLLVALALAPVWIVRAFPPPEQVVVQSLLYNVGGSLLPLLIGVGIAAVVHRTPSLGASLRRFRIPPGDLVVPIEAGLARMRPPSQERMLAPVAHAIDVAFRLRDRLLGAVGAMAEDELRALRGPMLGTVLLAVALFLAVALVH